jgi:phosphatidylglycerol:prolipoprotein diacylglycerol transferase
MAILYVSAFFFNSLFHTIEAGELKIGGITWLGGVFGAFPAMVFLIHKFVPAAKGKAVTYFSILVPGIVLAHALGRIGCFLAGCCYGSVTDSIFGVSFPAGSHAAHQYAGGPNGGSLPVLPTQLFEAVFELALFLVMLFTYKKMRGHNIEIYFIAYGIFRFALEFLRGDERGGTGFFLTPAQLLCVIMWIAAALLILFKKRMIFHGLYRKCEVWQAEVVVEAKRKRKAHGAQLKLNKMEALRELKGLYDEGILTEEEYESKRQKLTDEL